MLVLLFALALANAAVAEEVGANQLLEFLQNHKEPAGIIHTSYGYPVTYNEANLGINRDSNFLLNHYVYESTSSFSLERIPPRANHPNGNGAKGYFVVTHDIKHIINANLFNRIGKKTPVLARFSGGNGEIGSSELKARTKGFAIKFYTEEGNWDLVGLSTDAFSTKDPAYITFAHTIRDNPKTGITDSNMFFDFLSLRTEALFAFMQILTPAGQPRSYKNIAAHAIHTFQVENRKGKTSFVRFNWLPDAGVESLNNTELATLTATSPDYLTENLYNTIANGTYPSWTLYIQVVPKTDVNKYNFDLFDVTLNWPVEDFPNIPVGKIVLNSNVDNHFAEVEQAAFNPGNLPPGIRGVDKVFEARRFIYRDAQIYRLGTGFNKIKVNCPINKPQTYNRDGHPPVGDNGGAAPNYYPNSFHGLVPLNKTLTPLYRPVTDPRATNYWQVAKFYYDLEESDREVLVTNLGGSLAARPASIRNRIMSTLVKIDSCMAAKVQAVIDSILASG